MWCRVNLLDTEAALPDGAEVPDDGRSARSARFTFTSEDQAATEARGRTSPPAAAWRLTALRIARKDEVTMSSWMPTP